MIEGDRQAIESGHTPGEASRVLSAAPTRRSVIKAAVAGAAGGLVAGGAVVERCRTLRADRTT